MRVVDAAWWILPGTPAAGRPPARWEMAVVVVADGRYGLCGRWPRSWPAEVRWRSDRPSDWLAGTLLKQAWVLLDVEGSRLLA